MSEPIIVKNIIPIEFCYFLTHILLRNNDYCKVNGGDEQVPNCISVMHHEVVFETIQERLWPIIESIYGEELLPTYSFSRLYTNENVLKPHTDRSECEVSVTIQLGRSHNYSWPIYMDGKEYDLSEGDGVIYNGCDSVHWREVCYGPENYYSGQCFLHYVKKNGKYNTQFGDPSVRKIPSFVKLRTYNMEEK
jgi:hypothetical protein